MNFQSFRHRLLKQRKFRQLLIACSVLSIFFGLIIVPIERDAGNLTMLSPIDGLWWSIQTLTTVGYGDVVPVTAIGRMIGAVMQLIGAVMFGSLIAIISTSMSRRQEEFYWNRLFERLDALESKTNEVEKHTGYLVKGGTLEHK